MTLIFLSSPCWQTAREQDEKHSDNNNTWSMAATILPLTEQFDNSTQSSMWTTFSKLQTRVKQQVASLRTGGSDLQISPSCGGPGPVFDTMLLRITRVFLPNEWHLTPFNGFRGVHERHRHTYRWIIHATWQHLPQYSSPIIWNAISLSVRDAPSISSFKRRLKSFSFTPLSPNLCHLVTTHASDSSYAWLCAAWYNFTYVCMYVCNRRDYCIQRSCLTIFNIINQLFLTNSYFLTNHWPFLLSLDR